MFRAHADEASNRMAARDDSGRVPTGRSTATISVAQTAPIRIHHLTEILCADEPALRRSLPEAAERVLRLTAGRSADAAAIEAALAPDPALAGPLVSLATSGLFAPRAPIGSVREAVMRLGLEATRDALLVIVMNGIAAAVPGFETRAEGLRRRALAAAIAGRLIARTLRVESGHDFLVGLMHDAGELVLLQRSAEEGILPPGILDDPKDGPVILGAIETDHARVGAALSRAWGLPPAVAEAAEFHHDRRAGRRGRLPSQLAAATDVVALQVTGAASPDAARDPIFGEVGLPAEVAAKVIAEVEATLPALATAGTTARRA
jgi:HD-like signal output (HDOD) protein